MKRPTIEKIKEVMSAQGMTVFHTPFDVTMGGIRTKDNSSNKFNDWLFAFLHTPHGGIMDIVAEGTTDAGLFYRENPLSVDGTAIIKHGVQHRGAYQYQNPSVNPSQRGHKGAEAFRQVSDMQYWRDADRDKYLEFDGKEYTGNFSTNGHDMGKVGGTVDKWSAGCWGSTHDVMDLFYAMAKLQIGNGLGDKFSFAMLHEDMF